MRAARSLLALCASSALSAASAAFNLSNVFGSHMVLQRDEAFAVWGWGCNGPVTTLFNGTKFTTDPDPVTTMWLQPLPAQPGGYTPYTLVFTCAASGEALTLSDVLFGDVFFFFGQRCVGWGVPSWSWSCGVSRGLTNLLHHSLHPTCIHTHAPRLPAIASLPPMTLLTGPRRCKPPMDTPSSGCKAGPCKGGMTCVASRTTATPACRPWICRGVWRTTAPSAAQVR